MKRSNALPMCDAPNRSGRAAFDSLTLSSDMASMRETSDPGILGYKPHKISEFSLFYLLTHTEISDTFKSSEARRNRNDHHAPCSSLEWPHRWRGRHRRRGDEDHRR